MRNIHNFIPQKLCQIKFFLTFYLHICKIFRTFARNLDYYGEFVVTHDEAKLRPLTACRTYGSQMFSTATAAIIIALDPTLCDNTWMADGAIAAEHILLAAAEQGVGACWCHVYEREGAPELTHRLFGIPDHLVVLCAIALGYPDEEKNEHDLARLKYEKVHKERF